MCLCCRCVGSALCQVSNFEHVPLNSYVVILLDTVHFFAINDTDDACERSWCLLIILIVVIGLLDHVHYFCQEGYVFISFCWFVHLRAGLLTNCGRFFSEIHTGFAVSLSFRRASSIENCTLAVARALPSETSCGSGIIYGCVKNCKYL